MKTIFNQAGRGIGASFASPLCMSHKSFTAFMMFMTMMTLAVSSAVAQPAASVAASAVPAMRIIPLDDSMSIIHNRNVKLQYDNPWSLARRGDMVRTRAHATLIFDLSPYAGKRVRIQQTMAPSASPWQVSWQGRGLLMDSGESRPGMRVPIFEGVLPPEQRRFQADMYLQFSVEARLHLREVEDLNFSYDIEVLP